MTSIPPSSAPDDLGLEARPFLNHELLGSVMPPSNVALAWIRAQPGQDVSLRSRAVPRLLTILRGHAELVGQTRQRVSPGDVITLPSNVEYGFASVGPDGIHGLTVDFHERGAARSSDVTTLEQLLARNEQRAQMEIAGPFFSLLRGGESDPRRRTVMRDGIRVFSDAFQTILLTRQATCRDGEFSGLFLSHFREELGHNDLLHTSGNARASSDPILRATSAWFCHQMLVLDNIGKAVLVHLVLETAGYHFHTMAKRAFAQDVSRAYFDMHSEADEEHMAVAVRLLERQHPDTYRRLHRVIEDGWDMFHAMGKRIAQLVELDRQSS